METIELQKVDKDTLLANALLNFVENFSWLDVKVHAVKVIKNWEFNEWETPFVAMVNGRIVGMVTIIKRERENLGFQSGDESEHLVFP